MMIPGIWGPYFSAILGNYWLHEGGQSAVGSLIDHLIQSHPAYQKIEEKLKASKETENIYSYLEAKCVEMKHEKNLDSIHNLTKNLHVFPDFHGNRSPLADPEMKGSIIGLDLDKSEKNLALIYLSTIQALAYETKLIVDHLTRYALRFLKSKGLMWS